jgi:serine/threonine protein kinase/TPR repeat protein
MAEPNSNAPGDPRQTSIPAPGSRRTVTLSPMDPPELPDEIGRLGGYRVLRVIGHGGMGVVYEAEDPNLRRHVALKCLLAEVATRPGNKERFLREARATAAVEHENVIPIHQVGIDHEVPFLVMPLLKGCTLKHRLDVEKPLPLNEFIRITREICHGLKAAHDKGLIHRDIKPDNIWLDAKSGRVRILDFGLARVNDDSEMRSQGGHLVGTPGYISPEQIAGEEVDVRSDLFSLGCMVYEMSTGRPPFSGANFLELLTNVTTQTPTVPKVLQPDLPDDLSDLIYKLIAKQRENRPADVSAVLEVLDRYAPVTTPPPSSSYSQHLPPIPDSRQVSATKNYTPEPQELVLPKTAKVQQRPATVKQVAKESPVEERKLPFKPKPSAVFPLIIVLGSGVLLLSLVGGLVFLLWPPRETPPTASTQPGTSSPTQSPPTLTPPTISPPTVSPPTLVTPPTVSPPTISPPTMVTPPTKPKVVTPDELYQRGLKLLQDPGLKPDYAKALADFEKASQAGYNKAWFQLGYFHYYGLAGKLDRLAAIQAYRRGDIQKDSLSSFALGITECEGEGQPRNLSAGTARILRVWKLVESLAEQGDPQAMVLLGDAFLEGYSVPKDREKAVTLFRRAALALDGNAMNHLATAYKEGWGIEQSDERRLSLLKQSRDRGFILSLAHLGDLYREDKLNPPNLAEALKHYKEAADAGYAQARLRQASTLTELKLGDEAKPVYQQAFAELWPLAEAGDRRAQYDLATLYVRDKSIPNNNALAVEWLTKSAEQDLARAQYQLGVMLWQGIGVEAKRPTDAKLWLRKAADQDYKPAMDLLKKLGN